MKLLNNLQRFYFAIFWAASNVVNAAVPVQSTMQTVWVAENVVHNGVPMSIQSFKSAASVDNVFAFYQTQWANPVREGVPGFVRSEAGGWQVISRLEHGVNMVVQAKAGEQGGSEGFISEAKISAITVDEKKISRFPRMSGSDVVSMTESSDAGRNANTFILTNHFSVESNSTYYQSKFEEMGWDKVLSEVNVGTSVLMFNSKGAQIDITISANDRGLTVIYANLVEN
jgi:hypothetical protein